MHCLLQWFSIFFMKHWEQIFLFRVKTSGFFFTIKAAYHTVSPQWCDNGPTPNSHSTLADIRRAPVCYGTEVENCWFTGYMKQWQSIPHLPFCKCLSHTILTHSLFPPPSPGKGSSYFLYWPSLSKQWHHPQTTPSSWATILSSWMS